MPLTEDILFEIVIAAVTVVFLYIVWVLGRLGNHGLAIGLVIVAGAIIIAALVVVLVRLLDKVAIRRMRVELARDRWRKIKNARQRLVLCRLMIDIMRTVHGAYAPDTERFGARLETFFIGLCVALGDMEDKPLSVAKISGYMGVPRTTVIRRLNQLQKWGLIYSRRRRYYTREKTLNSLLGMRSYQEVRRILSKATQELIVLDKLPD